MNNSENLKSQKNVFLVVEKLVKSFFNPSETFINSLKIYLSPLSRPLKVDPYLNELLLKERSKEAFELYLKISEQNRLDKLDDLIYIFLNLSNSSLSLEEELKINLKKGALGFEVSYFNPIKIYSLKNKINYALYNIATQIYAKSLIYKKLKIEMQSPVNLIHKSFLEDCAVILKEYENLVINSKNDFLSFHNGMYLIYQNLNKISRINDLIRENKCFKKEFNISIFDSNFMDSDIFDFKNSFYKVYNEFIREYFLKGGILDPHGEFFIKDHILDYGLIPPFISKNFAEDICYIGCHTDFLKKIGCLNLDNSIVEIIKNFDVSKHSAKNYLKLILINLNNLLKKNFIEKYKIFKIFNFLNSTFLFSRSDFIENLFVTLKNTRKISKKNILSILENSLSNSFPNNSYLNSLFDIFMDKNEFSIYLKLDFPVSFLIEETLILKLVSIFRFLWKLKKVDHLSRRIKNPFYINLIQKINYYVHNEVIGMDFKYSWDNLSHSLTELKKSINKRIDFIIKNLFINTKDGKIENLIHSMEIAFISAGKGEVFNDLEIQSLLKEFYLSLPEVEGTALFNLESFIRK